MRLCINRINPKEQLEDQIFFGLAFLLTLKVETNIKKCNHLSRASTWQLEDIIQRDHLNTS